MKQLIVIVLSVICFSQNLYAIKATSGVVRVTQADGTSLKVQIHGDEFFNFYTTEDGYTIAKRADGYFYYADYNSGTLQISNSRVGTATKSGTTLTKGVSQGIIQMYRTTALRELQSLMLNQTKTDKAPNHPQKVLVILAQYSDRKFVTPLTREAFSNQLNQVGYSFNDATGSAADYYYDNSMGKYRPNFVVSNVVTLPKSYKYYGSKTETESITSKAQEQTVEACKLAQAQGVNFSDFDGDSDGFVDIVFIYYAGHNSAEGDADAVWPHRWGINQSLVLDGKKIQMYACTSELRGASGATIAGIGTACHEFGHVLGLPDIYSTDGQQIETLGSLALMDAGSYNNFGRTPPTLTAVEREYTGWLKFEKITKAGSYSLECIDKNRAYIIETENKDEFFILENRQGRAWDRYINNGTEANPKGMLVMHIDRSQNLVNGETAASRWVNNTLNNVPSHQCIDLVRAYKGSGWQQTSELFFPGSKQVTNLTHTSIPNNRPWSGKVLGKNIVDIRLDGDLVKFEIVTNTDNPAPYPAISLNSTPYSVGDELKFAMKNLTAPHTKITYKMDGKVVTDSYIFTAVGKHTITAQIDYTTGDSETIKRILNVTAK